MANVFLDFLVSEEYDAIHYPEYSKHCTQSKSKIQQIFRSKHIFDNKINNFNYYLLIQYIHYLHRSLTNYSAFIPLVIGPWNILAALFGPWNILAALFGPLEYFSCTVRPPGIY